MVETDNITSFAFLNGWNRLTKKQAVVFRNAVMSEFKINSRKSFYNRLNGLVEPTVTEAKFIENEFKKLKITKIWGNESGS